MFTLSEQPLNPGQLTAELGDPRAGALVVFDGWVRDHHQGRKVLELEYEAFAAMAQKSGNAILEEARRRFAIIAARVEHRVGRLEVGERAIWVGVTAEHRQDAFLACRWIMDRIKAEVPVWKKEFFATGKPRWVHAGDGSRSVPEDPAADPRYARQVALTEVGVEGQRNLAAARVLVIGAGGLGCPALLYLAAAGVGHITVCDGDRVEASNLHRQVLFSVEDIGLNKAVAAGRRLNALHPDLVVDTVPDAADPASLPALLQGRNIVLDCTDSFQSKYAIHDACFRTGLPLVQAAVYQFDGWVQLIDPAVRDAGCFRCLWPEPPPVGCVGNCAQAGVLGVTPGLLGTHQAVETLKYLLQLPDRLDHDTLYVDVLGGGTRRLRRPLRADCPCQGTVPWPALDETLLYPGARAEALFRRARVIDLREPDERIGDPEWVHNLPNVPRAEWSQIPERFRERPLILCCAAGARSRKCLELLEQPAEILCWTRGILEIPR